MPDGVVDGSEPPHVDTPADVIDEVAVDPADDELVVRAAAGDREAFHELYLRHVRPVAGFLHRRVRDRHLVEDLTAETFCRAYENLPKFELRGVPFRAWLMRIALNLVLSRQRSKASGEIVVDVPPEVRTDGHEGLVLSGLEAEAVRRALGGLSENHRTVLVLRYFDELSVHETAELLDMTDEAVRSATYRAIGALRSSYVADGGAP